MNADQVITAVTEADTKLAAYRVLDTVPRKTLEAVADQLYIDTVGRSVATVRKAVVAECRA